MEIFLLLVPVGFAILLFYLRSPKVRGAQGENRVRATLSRNLNANEYTVLNDVLLPVRNGTTQVDHIVVSRCGVFVIETKNMSGWIFGGEDQQKWTQVFPTKKIRFTNPIRQNEYHKNIVQNLLKLDESQVYNLVAFVGSAQPKTPMPAQVFWSRRTLFKYIETRPEVKFSNSQMRELVRMLRSGALENTKATRKAHMDYVRSRTRKKANGTSACPSCGAKMVERSNRKTGSTFLGCSRFPQCRGTRQLN